METALAWGAGGDFAIVSSGMRECLTSPDGISAEDQSTMEKLFLTLA